MGHDNTSFLPGTLELIALQLLRAERSPAYVRTLVVRGVVDEPATDGHEVYLPLDPAPNPYQSMLIRTTSAAEPLIPTIRRVAQEAAPALAIPSIVTIAALEAAERNLFHLVIAALAGATYVALFLSAIGLYAVLAFTVGQRNGEIAVRMVVGARTRQIAAGFIADGLRLSTVGLVVGLPLSLFGFRIVNPPVALPPVATTAALGVLVVAVAATWIPARRAAGVDPAITLRRE